MGGRIASQIAGTEPRVEGMVLLGYPLHAPGREDKLRDSHLDAVPCPMLFVRGTRDKLAGQDLIRNVVGRLGPRGTLVDFEGGDHSFKKRKSDPGGPGVDEARDAVTEWLRRSF
jgi:predicted alpha/beta-hydrolase family hydrolase